jgi:hypothetical protein
VVQWANRFVWLHNFQLNFSTSWFTLELGAKSLQCGTLATMILVCVLFFINCEMYFKLLSVFILHLTLVAPRRINISLFLMETMSYVACLFRQVSGYYHNMGPVDFFPHPFQFVMQCHPTMQCCLFRATESISNKHSLLGPLCSLCKLTCSSLTLAWWQCDLDRWPAPYGSCETSIASASAHLCVYIENDWRVMWVERHRYCRSAPWTWRHWREVMRLLWSGGPFSLG